MSILLFSMSAFGQGILCEKDNDSLQAMPAVSVTFTREDGSTYELQAKLADNNATRAAGFQRVCEQTIEATPILFAFHQRVMPRFHMNNVVAPIDIAFIDESGAIESIQAMQPYSLVSRDKPLYGPKRPIVLALEAHKGFYRKHDLDLKTTVAWRKE
jgi:uncharacterized membrane protein (UPF0127 family)